ncbi:hypothetical protein HPP92_005054 [Vanilla planifolia]|uniref:Pentatricopeptide repeat-containing protein n=1 Tax=Vanilla planifolia TaxID=51239 RepID=A0A835RMS4_VANPL|nr:hypothetical protein HPP92_005054 [Vanilla planifolia]
MSILSTARRRRRSLLSRVSAICRSNCSAAAACAASCSSSTPPTLTPSAAKSRLRKEFDPDKVLSIISSLPSPSSCPSSCRFAIELAVRRLISARRFADIQTLLESRKFEPAASQESFLATVIFSYGSAGMLNRAISTFEDIPGLCSAVPTTVSFNALLSAAIRAKKPHQVPKIFSEISEKHSITPDNSSYGVLVKALCLSGKVDKAFEILKEMDEKGLKVTAFIYTTLIDSLYKEGKPVKAEELWNEMLENGCKPDLVTHNVKVMYQALHGSPEKVLKSISEFEAAGLKPDVITYNYLMSCYSRNGRFGDVMEVYKGLKSKGCDPNAATFKLLLTHLRKIGDFDAGIAVFKDSVRHNKIPDFMIMRPFVVGLAKNSKVEEAKMVVSVVKQRFPGNLLGEWILVEKELGLNAK